MPWDRESELADVAHIFDDVGEAVTYLPKGGAAVATTAIIDRNGERPPPQGYSKTLSQGHHELTFTRAALGLQPKRGDMVRFMNPLESTYTVDFVRQDDAETITVAVR